MTLRKMLWRISTHNEDFVDEKKKMNRKTNFVRFFDKKGPHFGKLFLIGMCNLM